MIEHLQHGAGAETVPAANMAGDKHIDEPGNAASTWRAAMAAWGRAADERDDRANGRECEANERETLADRREYLADEREALADKRELVADQREAAQSERQRELDVRERHLRGRARVPGQDLAIGQQRVLRTIEQARALLALRAERVDRQQAAVKRSQARGERQQAEIGRAAARSEREMGARQPDPDGLAERATVLRARIRAVIEAVAANEDEVARVHDDLAATDPRHRSQYQQAAEQARTGAGKARDVARAFAEPR